MCELHHATTASAVTSVTHAWLSFLSGRSADLEETQCRLSLSTLAQKAVADATALYLPLVADLAQEIAPPRDIIGTFDALW